jgi:hypothetical protein
MYQFENVPMTPQMFLYPKETLQSNIGAFSNSQILKLKNTTPPLVAPPTLALYSNNTAMSYTGIRQILGAYISPRTYFDYGCHEFEKKFSWEQKLQRLAEFVYQGYDLKKYLRSYIRYYSRPGYAHMNGALEQTLQMFIHYIRAGEVWKHYLSRNLRRDTMQLIMEFILELRKDLFLKPEKYPFVEKQAKKSKHLRRYRTFELEQLLNAYLMEDAIYHQASVQQLGLDISETNQPYWQSKDEMEASNFPYSYQHLETLLQRSFLPAMKGKMSLNDIRLDMGCSANQFYYLKTWSMNKDKDQNWNRYLLRTLTLDLMLRLYGKKPQRMPNGNYYDIENWGE